MNKKNSLNEIQQFMSLKNLAIIGVSRNDKKFGNTILKELKNKAYNLYPVHPELKEISGTKCYTSIQNLPASVEGVIICTKPENTFDLVKHSVAKGIKHIFLQQGAQNDEAINWAREQGVNIIHRKCALMFAEPVTSIHKFHRTLSKIFGAYPR